jgi:hypothetical protein
MKIQTLALALGLVAITPSAMATVIAADNFNNAGELNGQNGGIGWAGAWSANTGITQVASTGGVQFTGNNNNAAYRQLASSFSGNQLFVDYYVQIDRGSLTNNDFLALWLDTTNAGDHTTRPNIGIKSDGSGSNDVFARTTGTGGSFVPNSNIGSTNGVTYHIVGLLSKSGGNYNSFAVWLDPVLSDLGSPDALFSGNSGVSQLTTIGFRTANLDSGDAVSLDNLRLSTTWNEALSVPEPATLALLGMGLFGMMVGVRRKI